MNSFFEEYELKELGFKEVGTNVKVSKKSSIYGAENIKIGNNVRIDDFCVLSGNITLGNNIHIAAYSALYGGQAGISIDDFANVSSRVCIYAISDDYSGETMTNPTVPDKYKKVQSIPVVVKRHVIIGSGCTILPGVVLEEGVAIGAMSLCKYSTVPWMIYAGVPAKTIRERSKNILKLEKEYLDGED